MVNLRLREVFQMWDLKEHLETGAISNRKEAIKNL
jgi:hypothetical protein